MDLDPKTAVFSVEIEGIPYLLATGETFQAMAKDKNLPIPNHLEPNEFYLCDKDDTFQVVKNVKIANT